jgi:hypothetical protein
VKFIIWDPDELLRIACELLPYVQDRDFSELRAVAKSLALGSATSSIGCGNPHAPGLIGVR